MVANSRDQNLGCNVPCSINPAMALGNNHAAYMIAAHANSQHASRNIFQSMLFIIIPLGFTQGKAEDVFSSVRRRKREKKGSGFRFFSKLFETLCGGASIATEPPNQLAHAHWRAHV
jgi:hypothetical protein